ncbi:hypothetical protein [Natronobacterium haloterrestre]|nr:hypothetical protein [Halobiforma haloterrestris]
MRRFDPRTHYDGIVREPESAASRGERRYRYRSRDADRGDRDPEVIPR